MRVTLTPPQQDVHERVALRIEIETYDLAAIVVAGRARVDRRRMQERREIRQLPVAPSERVVPGTRILNEADDLAAIVQIGGQDARCRCVGHDLPQAEADVGRCRNSARGKRARQNCNR